MLYPNEKTFNNEKFLNPGKEYRGAPFWSWNCVLEKDELIRQISVLREMGFGGFHMHVRMGLSVPYMDDDFLDLISLCTDKAKKEDMLAWLYDEDRWPSGFAGGLVTREEKYRGRYLLFSPEMPEKYHKFLGRFDITLNSDGTLASYRLLKDGEKALGDEWYACVKLIDPSPRYNNATYSDTLNKAAIDKFIELTHEKYYRRLGNRFGKDIPAIFTDEPQFYQMQTLGFANERHPVTFAWTDDLPDTFAAAYGGEELIPNIPQLVWNLPDGKPSVIRYHFHDHVCERFANAFADNIGAWCEGHGLALTGHMMSEDTLRVQTSHIGEAMRSYRGFTIPGIDILCGAYKLATAKQAQSAAHQYGKEGMMSELYGVMGWDLDFRNHKLQGDWQAALGVTLRVPHLAWVSMEGESKRDYPQSISYQSPWYRKYPYIEDHFARLNTALTRGRPHVRVAVIHPIESYWLHFGSNDVNSAACERLEENFTSVTSWLLFGGIDFDYICESQLPALCSAPGAPLKVGEMSYDAVVVPGCETLRKTTCDILASFREHGGKLIFMGESPLYTDASDTDSSSKDLYAVSEKTDFSKRALLNALEDYREIAIFKADGSMHSSLLHCIRDDENGEKWIFIAHGTPAANPDIPAPEKVLLKIRGHYSVKLYNTLDGSISDIPVTFYGNFTQLERTMDMHDSLLLRLIPSVEQPVISESMIPQKFPIRAVIPQTVPFTLSEPNVLLLDCAAFSLDGGKTYPPEELLRADNICRELLSWGTSGGHLAQPWCVEEEAEAHTIKLTFEIESEIECDNVLLAIERPEKAEIIFNGTAVSVTPVGYYTDRSIKTLSLPHIRAGVNTMTVTLPYEKRKTLEWCYLLGNFGVKLNGRRKCITSMPETIGFGSITNQLLPFYSGKLTYHIPVALEHESCVCVHVPQYRAAVLEVSADGKDQGLIAFSPYSLTTEKLSAGRHTIDISAYINRTNTFGSLHNTDRKLKWLGPTAWRTEGDCWTYEYELYEEGVIHSPIITYED